jgi:hypothetical protein
MALWGNKDSKTASGTVSIASTGVVTGSSTAFTTQAAIGNTIKANSVEYQIVSITSDTVAGVIMGTNNGNGSVTTCSAQSYTLSEKPVYVAHGSTDSVSIMGNSSKVFGVDSTEEAQTEAKAKGIAHAGWVRYHTYTDAQGNVRNKSEVLVAANSITGDQADDTTLPDGTITIGTQPTSIASAATPYTGTFTVAATALPTASLSYQWQVSTNGGTSFTNVTNAGVYTGATSATLTLTSAAKVTYNNYQYRCNVSATGYTTVTSTAATLVYA